MASYTYTADLQLHSEDFGTKLNSRSVTPLHPDVCVTPDEVDSAKTNLLGNRPATRSTYLPGKLGGNNIIKRDAETFVDEGVVGAYTKFQYGKVWDDDSDPSTPDVVHNGLVPNGSDDILEVS